MAFYDDNYGHGVYIHYNTKRKRKEGFSPLFCIPIYPPADSQAKSKAFRCSPTIQEDQTEVFGWLIHSKAVPFAVCMWYSPFLSANPRCLHDMSMACFVPQILFSIFYHILYTNSSVQY